MSREGNFWRRVKLPNDIGECWVWDGYLDKDGYGTLWWEGRTRRAHQVGYFLAYGVMPKGFNDHLDHLCETRSCVNSMHLERITPAKHRRRRGDRLIWGSIHHCKNGHKYSDVGIYKYGNRIRCKACEKNLDNGS